MRDLNPNINLVGYCGKNCSKCKIYRYTIEKSAERKNKLLKDISKEFEFYMNEKIDESKLRCYGCRDPRSLHQEYLNIKCNIHECASQPDKDPLSCVHCDFWPCTKIKIYFKQYSIHPKKAIIKTERKLKSLFRENSDNNESIKKWLEKKKKI